VILAAAILSPISVIGAAFHIAAHAFGKITLFFAAGSIMVASNKTLVSQLDGVGRRMPWTMAAFFIGALSMIGLPPTAGFVSKWYILTGAFDADQMAAVAVIVLSTLLNAGYFLPIVYRAFFRKDPTKKALAATAKGIDKHHAPRVEHGEAPVFIVIALTITAAGTVALFLFPDIPLGLARQLTEGTP
jgi:multicomponent Na+:H+ antiporter subunit D